MKYQILTLQIISFLICQVLGNTYSMYNQQQQSYIDSQQQETLNTIQNGNSNDLDDSLTVPDDFKGGLFKFNDKKSQLYLMDVFQNPNNMDQENIMMGYADFNNDYYVDFVTTRRDKTQTFINIFYWEQSNQNFIQQPIYTLEKGNIVNLIPIDINYDGKLDLIILYQTSANQSTNVYALIQKDSKNFSVQSQFAISKLTFASNTQPFIINYLNSQNTRNMQLLYENQSKQERKFININAKDISKAQDFKEIQDPQCTTNPTSYRPFTVPNFNALVDINGDCRSDILITSQDPDTKDIYLEIWIYQSSGLYCMEQEFKVNQQSEGKIFKSIQFEDFNFDGSVDIAILVTDSNQVPYLKIIENTLKIKVSDTSICNEGGKWSFPNFYQQIDIYTLSGYTLPDTSQYQQNGIQNVLRSQDVNIDGYNDLIIILKQEINGVTTQNPYILLNQGNKSKGKIVEFKIQSSTSSYAMNLQLIKNDIPIQYQALSASYYDINDNGVMDYFINYIDPETQQIRLLVVYNNLLNQNYYLKMMTLNGNKNGKQAQNTQYYGGNFLCQITQNNNKSTFGRGLQLSQSSFSALQQPFTVIGLGRTNQYVQYLSSGYPQTSQTSKIPNQNSWVFWSETIIPNSQLIVYPYSPSNKDWKIDVFIQSTNAVITVTVVVIITLVILGLSLFICHRQEKKEDKKDRYNFY